MNWLHAGMSVTLDGCRSGGGRRHVSAVAKASVHPGLLLGWEHIGLTGDYVWSTADQPPAGALRPLRRRQSLQAA
jgi:hypothetical protein